MKRKRQEAANSISSIINDARIKWTFIISSVAIHTTGLMFGLAALKMWWPDLPIKLLLVLSALGGIVFGHVLHKIIARAR